MAESKPTVGNLVNSLASNIRPQKISRKIGSLPAETQDLLDRGRKMMLDALQVTPLEISTILEEHSYLEPYLADWRTAAILPDGDIGFFSTGETKGQATKAKAKAKDYAYGLLNGRYDDALSSYPVHDRLPAHVRALLASYGISADAVDVLTALFGKLEFRQDKALFKFENSWKTKVFNRIIDNNGPSSDRNLRGNPDPSLKEYKKIQITLPGSPRVRITKHGVTVGVNIPRTACLTMPDKPLSAIICLPNMEDYLIQRAVPSANNVTRIILQS